MEDSVDIANVDGTSGHMPSSSSLTPDIVALTGDVDKAANLVCVSVCVCLCCGEGVVLIIVFHHDLSPQTVVALRGQLLALVLTPSAYLIALCTQPNCKQSPSSYNQPKSGKREILA